MSSDGTAAEGGRAPQADRVAGRFSAVKKRKAAGDAENRRGPKRPSSPPAKQAFPKHANAQIGPPSTAASVPRKRRRGSRPRLRFPVTEPPQVSGSPKEVGKLWRCSGISLNKPANFDHKESKRLKLRCVDVEHKRPVAGISGDVSQRSNQSYKLRQGRATFPRAPQIVKRDTKWITFGDARFGFEFERRVRALDDLDDAVAAGAACLPDLPLFKDSRSSGFLSLETLAELAVVHDFVHVFSGELFDFSFTNAAGKHVSLEHLEQAIMDRSGFSRKLAKLHVELVNYIYADQGQETHIDVALDFQQFAAALLVDSEESAVLRTAEYPDIPPETRVSILSKLVSMVIGSNRFASHLRQLEFRQVELRKESLQRSELRQTAEPAIAAMQARCASLESRIAEIEASVEQSTVEHTDVENQTRPSDAAEAPATRTTELPDAEKRRLLAKQKDEVSRKLVRESRALAAKQRVIKEMNAKDDRYDADKEMLASQLRGGNIALSAVARSGVIKLGYDRWGRTYWHWRSIGGVLVEEAPELPERNCPARGADEVAKAYLPASITLDVPPSGDQDDENPCDGAPTTIAPGSSPSQTESPHSEVGLLPQRPRARRFAPKWWYISDVELFREVFRSLNERGEREKELKTRLAAVRRDIEDSYPAFEKWLRRRRVLPQTSPETPYPRSQEAAASPERITNEGSGEAAAAPANADGKADEAPAETDPDRMSMEEYLSHQARRILSMAVTLRDIVEEYNEVGLEGLEEAVRPPPPFDPSLPVPPEALDSNLPRRVAEHVLGLVAGVAALHAGGGEARGGAECKLSRKGKKPPPAAVVAGWTARHGYFGTRGEPARGAGGSPSGGPTSVSAAGAAPALGVTAVWLGSLLRELESVLGKHALRRALRRRRTRAPCGASGARPADGSEEAGADDAGKGGEGEKESGEVEGARSAGHGAGGDRAVGPPRAGREDAAAADRAGVPEDDGGRTAPSSSRGEGSSGNGGEFPSSRDGSAAAQGLRRSQRVSRAPSRFLEALVKPASASGGEAGEG